MAQQQEPKKPKRPKSKRLNINNKKQWESILRDVDKFDVPIELMESIVVNLTDGTTVIIDIKTMLAEGADPDLLQVHIDERLESLDHIIEDVDFYISVDEVRKTVQPFTDNILKNL
jgi:hypothetical protein